ncbi:Hpt domain-containing protein [Sphingobacterium yanglingense]|uniref:HPt (Histidine-containing phosphotransfer) domain-containing protein n=1 Tax=Sphingobacterium yanglingense TaxID=1437280 RepID=A0A4V3DEG2_9SPHI|nr:Hpt domain-containing protein [Sphingobacterium yanglingense]TDQ81281.1 HPt (histidine-containing phosphotransfer) domain-containing protein [Sphingobacterium yanglingense]
MAYKIINPESINKSMMGNPKMVKQFIEMYIEQSPLDFQALILSVLNDDKNAIRDSAHHIKPTMEYIGASKLRSAFQELENMGRDGMGVEAIRIRFEEIRSDFDLMIAELKSFTLENEKQIKD